MSLRRFPDLYSFLATYFPDSDRDDDVETTRSFAKSVGADKLSLVLSQGQALLKDAGFSFEEFGSEANRWFGDAEEARAWLSQLLGVIEESRGSQDKADSSVIVTKDSHGAVLQEGDSVTVIKDLKVKGGSSDLKRGTMIKKIHLIDDADHIEARVDGSTLVLKTCFLKKA